MQRLLLTICLGAAAAFAPPARTLTSRTALGVNPIDIYSAAEDCLQEECSVDTVPRSAVIIVTSVCPIVGDDATRASDARFPRRSRC